MESNGIPGKIQISQATADALSLYGKSHWFTPRPDRIQAKGKGELQTYFVTMGGGTGSATTRDVTSNDPPNDEIDLMETLREEVCENDLGDHDSVVMERQLADYMEKQDRGSQYSRSSV